MRYSWETLFQPHILRRGAEYYETGAVLVLEQSEDWYDAIVDGNSEYRVTIQYHDGDVEDMECDCPYALDGKNCKHMAAVLYEIEALRRKTVVSPGRPAAPKVKIEEVIEKIPESELRTLLSEICSEDEHIKNRIMLQYSRPIPSTLMEELDCELDAIADRYADCHGYIDWENAFDYGLDIEDFLCKNVKILVNRNCPLQAFELTNKALISAGEQDLDDSDGVLTGIANTGYQCWSVILQTCSLAEKRQIFSWFQDHLFRDALPEYMEDIVSDFFENEFLEEEFLLKKMDVYTVSDDVIPAEDDWYAYHRYEHQLVQKLIIMDKLGYSQQLSEYVQKYYTFPGVRRFAIDNLLQSGQDGDAIQLLQESKQLDHAHAGLVSEYSNQLIQLFNSSGNTAAYKNELLFHIFHCRQDGLDNILMLKSCCDSSEWEDHREQIFSASTCWNIRHKLMVSEGLTERLLQEVAASASPFLLDQYEPLLKKQFPERVRDIYIDYVIRSAKNTSDRKQYRHLIHYLKKLRQYPGGAAAAAEISANWRIQYARRSAMMDELNQAGF